MRKSTTTPATTANVIAVSVVSFGNDPITFTLPLGSTVAQALTHADIVRSGQEIFVSGEVAEDADILENGDIVSVVTPKQAGAAA